MTFKSYYDGLGEREKTELRKQVMRRTGCSQATFYYWLSDRFKNNMNKIMREALSKITGIPVDDLFAEPVKEKAA